MGEKFIDSRVILMGRSQKSPSEDPSIHKDCWLTLGHFDWTKIEKIQGEESPPKVSLSAIWNNNRHLSTNDSSIYWHPIYIIKEVYDSEALKRFWKCNSSFMLICQVRSKGIICTADRSGQEIFEYLVDHCVFCSQTDGYTVYSPNNIDIQSLDNNVLFLRYRTLALSDSVLIMKSNSLVSLLDVLAKLQALSCVGDLYSYCCINPDSIDLTPVFPPQNDRIALMSIRLSIRDAYKGQQYLAERIGEKVNPRSDTLRGIVGSTDMVVDDPYFITGTEDINVQIKNLSSSQLCQCLYILLQKGNESPWCGFDDMITRLGISETRLMVDVDDIPHADPKYDRLEIIYEGLLQRFMKVMEEMEEMKKDRPSNFQITEYDWVRPISELLKGMRNVSNDNHLRQFCFVMLGGIVGLVDKCEEIVRDWRSLPSIDLIFLDRAKVNLKDKLTFVMVLTGKIANLMENMVRIEGELVHHPETRPLLFFIPANLLECYMSFTDRCIRYYYSREYGLDRAVNKTKRSSHPLIVVPELCDNIQIGIQPDEEKEFLLNVSLPVHMMYDPFSVIFSLVHEVTHCAGEVCRCRKIRFECFLSSVAYLIVDTFGLSDNGRMKEIVKETKFVLERLYPRETCKRLYMRYIEQEIPVCIDRFLEDVRIVDFLKEIYFDYSSYSLYDERVSVDEYHNIIKRNKSNDKTLDLKGTVSRVGDLFRESYADLGAVSLLSIQPQEYLELFHDNDKREGGAFINQAGYDAMIARIALVICTMATDQNSTFYQWVWGEEEIKYDMDIIVRGYCRMLLNPAIREVTDTGGINGYRTYVMLLIIDYLTACKKKMDNLDHIDNNKWELESIRNDFVLFARKQEFASNDFVRALERHRPFLYDWAKHITAESL